MAIVTVEDLQGSIEVVVFPRLYEQTRPMWIDGAILLIAGRIDHKGEEISLLADLAVDWDDAAAHGPGRVRARGRGRRSGRTPARPVGARRSRRERQSATGRPSPAVRCRLRQRVAGEPAPAQRPPMVSPIRADARGAPGRPLPPIAPPEPIPTYVEPGAASRRRRP